MNIFSLFKKKQLHNRLLILSALPESKEDVKRLYSNGNSDFLKSLISTFGVNDIDALWSKYSETAKALTSTLDTLANRGAVVVRDFTLSSLAMLKNFDTVVVLAHHSDSSDEIELSQGLILTSSFVNSVPLELQIMLDLTSCYSTYLVPRLKARIPQSRIIGIDVATTLKYRLFMLEQVIELMCKQPAINYLEALKQVLAQLSKVSGGQISANNVKVQLGSSSLQSTVFAPVKATRGESFIVSIFLHKPKDKDEVEIMAKAIDEDAQLRNSKKISVKIKKGDKVELLLAYKDNANFSVDKKKKGFTWDGETNSVEFCVSVSSDCKDFSFIGNIRTFVNKEPVCEMIFKTAIVDEISLKNEAASFEFKHYDKEAECNEAKSLLLNRLKSKEQELRAAIQDGQSATYAEKELEMCSKCIELLTPTDRAPNKNKVLKVFISSTSDMKPYRQLLARRILDLEMYPDMYEKWGQGNDYPRDVCCKHVLESDIFVLILGAKYGFVEPLWDKSMTEIEYRIALNAGIPMLVYIDKNYQEEIKELNQEEQDLAMRQHQLIKEISTRRLVSMFTNETSLALQVDPELLTIKNKLQ